MASNRSHSSPVKWYGILSRNDAVSKHCARCHRDYTIVYTDGIPRCVVPHVFRREPAAIVECNSDAGKTWERRYDSECCGPDVCIFEMVTDKDKKRGTGKFRQDGSAPCFRGDHTRNKDGASEDYNGINILPCLMERGECCREWLCGLQGDNMNIVWSDCYNRRELPRRR